MLTDGAGRQLRCVMMCILMRSESVEAICLDIPSKAFTEPGWDSPDQPRAFITSYNLAMVFHRVGKCGSGMGWWSCSCCSACVK